VSLLNVSAIVGVVLGGALILLLIVLFIILVFRRRHKHIRRSSLTSHGRRLPTFADVTLHSEIASFLPVAGSGNGLQGLDFGRPALTGDEVCRQPTAETDDMPPSYDSVVKSFDDVAVRRRRDGNLTSSTRRSQARLSLPPLSATVLPPGSRTHRRAESDAEEHIYEDPASLRRSVSRDGLGLHNISSYPVENCHEVLQENGGQSSPEVDDRSPLELLLALTPSFDDVVTPQDATAELLQSLPYSVTSNSSLNMPISSSQPRVPRVRLGTSALYCRPDSRTVDWCRSGDFLPSANQMRPFSPLSAIRYSEVTDSFAHPYQTQGGDPATVHNTHNTASFGGQQLLPVNRRCPHVCGDDPEIELRCQPTDVCSTLSGDRQNRHSSAVSCYSNDLSVLEDQFNSTSSARSSLTESEHLDMTQVSPLFDDDIIDNSHVRGN